MKKILIIVFAIISIIFPSFSQNKNTASENKMTALKEEEREIISKLTEMKDVNIMQLSTNMLKMLPKDKNDSPLSILAKEGNQKVIKVYEFGSTEAEKLGRELLQNFLSQMYLSNHWQPDIIVKQRDDANEVLIYGDPNNTARSAYNSLAIFSCQKGKKSVLIKIYGFTQEGTVAELINAFSK